MRLGVRRKFVVIRCFRVVVGSKRFATKFGGAVPLRKAKASRGREELLANDVEGERRGGGRARERETAPFNLFRTTGEACSMRKYKKVGEAIFFSEVDGENKRYGRGGDAEET
jgi:hypothetical protein